MDEWRPIIMSANEAMGYIDRGEEPPGTREDDIVFISMDMRLRDGKLADRDRLIFHQMRTGQTVPLDEAFIKGPERIDPVGDKEAAAAVLDELMSRGEPRRPRAPVNINLWMDEKAAGLVRHLRVEERGTWRYVAGRVAERYGFDWGEDQPTGMSLCYEAAQWFGEDFLTGVWN